MTSTPSAHDIRLADPALSANIYCAGHLDEVVARVVLPLWKDLAEARAEGRAWLWWMRYGKRGEHLKLRLHGDVEALDLDAVRGRLETSCAELFGDLPEAEEDAGDAVKTRVPPIDVEDRDKEDAEDRSLVFTTYQRHRLSLGDGDMFGDDRYCELFTRALGEGASLLLASLGENDPAAKLDSARLTLMMGAIASALDALGFGAGRRAEYLAYHRDWLLRFGVPRSHPDRDPADKSRRVFDQKLSEMAEKRRNSLLNLAWKHWREGAAELASHASWRRAVRELYDYASPIVGGFEFALDPRAVDRFDSILFKVLQGLANASGLRVFDEAYLHHILAAAARHGEPSRVAS